MIESKSRSVTSLAAVSYTHLAIESPAGKLILGSKMYCSKCGTAIAQGTVFCSSCGQPVNPPFASAPSAPVSGAPVPPIPGPYGGVSPAPRFPQSAYAGFWLRVVAHLIDGLLAGIAFAIVFLAGIAAVGIGSLKDLIHGTNNPEDIFTPVSYTHLDVYKRQPPGCPSEYTSFPT